MELLGPINNSVEISQIEAECLRKVYDMMEDDVNLKPMRKLCQDDVMMIFCRSYRYDPKSIVRVAKYLQLYATETYPELFACVDLIRLKPVLNKQIYQIVKTHSDDSPGMLILRMKRWKPSEVSPDDLVAAGMAYVFQMAMNSLSVQKNGVILIVDIDGFGFSHARQMSYDLTKKIMYCLTFASPIRILAHVVINTLMLFEKVYHVVKFVIPEKARKDIHILKKDLTTLHNLVPSKKLLPICLGGEIPDDDGFCTGVEEAVLKDPTLQNLITDVQKECNVKRKNL